MRASKHGLVALAAGLRLQAPDIRVSTVYPGRVATDMQRELRGFEGGDHREEDYLVATTVPGVITGVLRLPAEGVVEELVINPAS